MQSFFMSNLIPNYSFPKLYSMLKTLKLSAYFRQTGSNSNRVAT